MHREGRLLRRKLKGGSKLYTLIIPTGDNHETPIEKGMFVKLIFTEKKEVESMWVKVNEVDGNNFVGTLDNVPIAIPSIKFGDIVSFTLDHIRDIYTEKGE